MTTKPSGTLKEFLKTKKSDSRLVGPVERHMLTKPIDTSRRQDVLHPSELVKNTFCKKSAYFKLLGHTEEEQRPSLRLRSIFDEGHTIHAKWQGWLEEMGNLYGAWLCAYCDRYFWALSPDNCPGCNNHSYLKYKEVPLFDDELRISGHADGWVIGLGEPFIIEIKSIGAGTIRMEQPALLANNDGDLSKAWRDIRRPFPTHLRQGQLYLEVIRRMKVAGHFPNIDIPQECVFIYELKADQSYKEFVVSADQEIISDCLDTAFEIVHAVRVGQVPDCTVRNCKSCAQFKESE